MQQLTLTIPNARNTDPATSHLAGANLPNAHTQRAKLLAAYASKPLGLTDEQAGVLTELDKLPRCCYWKRCSELRQAGMIEVTGETRASTAGRLQNVCVITLEGIKALNK